MPTFPQFQLFALKQYATSCQETIWALLCFGRMVIFKAFSNFCEFKIKSLFSKGVRFAPSASSFIICGLNSVYYYLDWPRNNFAKFEYNSFIASLKILLKILKPVIIILYRFQVTSIAFVSLLLSPG